MQLLANGKQQWIDQNGAPLANGTVGFYAPGTLNPLTTYQDQAGTIQNTNPITLDSRGQAIVWGAGTFRQIVKDSAGNTIWDQLVSSADLNSIGYSSPTTNYSRPVNDKLADIVSVKDFGALGAGGNYDSQIASAISYAMSTGVELYWPAGTYGTTSNIANFHSVLHSGPGAIIRGGNTYYITPLTDSQTNTLYVAPGGNDANDGLTSSQPMATLQRVCDVMQGKTILPRLAQGVWIVSMAAGTFTEGGVWSKFASCANPVQFVGQVDGSGIPTTIIDGTGSSKTAGLYFSNGPSLITVQNVKANNFRANSVASGIVFANKGILQAYTINVWSNNNLWAGINADVISNWLVQGGTHTNNTNYGLRARGGVEISIGYNGGTSSNRVTISGSSSSGIQIWDNCAGHCDFVDIANCPTGIWLLNSSRTTHTNITMNTCNVGINAQYGSTFDYDATSTFTSVNDIYQLTAASQSIGSTDLAGQMLCYDKFNNRYTTGQGQWGSNPFSSTVHGWMTNKTGTCTFYYGAPNGATFQMMWGTPSSSTLAYMQLNTASPAYQWLLNGIVTLQHDANSVNPYRDNVSSCGLAAARWSVVYAGSGTINTSDEREKQDIRALNDAEIAVAKDLKAAVKAYRWKSAAAAKGDNARIHFGWIAQEVIATFQKHGLDAFAYGCCCYDKWDDIYEPVMAERKNSDTGQIEQYDTGEKRLVTAAGDRYGVRLDEITAFIVAVL